ncbi:MAG: hypothetical protein ABW135_05875 [Thermoleophilaceae bacterium]
MTTRAPHRLVLLGIATVALLAPASALAKVRCVPAQGPQCDASYATIGAAVAAAASADEILIGPGTHMASISTSKRLHFDGAGAHATTVESLNGPALRLRGGGTIASLAVHGGTNGDDGSPAIRIDPAAVGKLAFHVVDVVARGGDEADPDGAPGGGLSVWGDFNERATVFVDGGSFRAGAGEGFYFAAMGFGGTHVRAASSTA